MEVGTEISQKIRSAIKAKLIELGAYVDDELPDYIMVMVANKKNQDQMISDLNLFLGKHTNVFAEWLHGLLGKLQTISVDTSAKNVKEKKKGDSKKEKVKKGSKKISKSENSAAKTKTVSSTSQKNEATNNTNTSVEQTTETSSKPSNSKTIGNGNQSVEVEDVRQMLVTVAPTDELAAELETTEARIEQSKTATNHKTRSPEPKNDNHAAAVSRKRSVSPESDRRVQSSSVPKRHRGLTSVVANVSKGNEEEEEYDPLSPAVGSVASVVKVTSRKSRIPPALQANSVSMEMDQRSVADMDSDTEGVLVGCTMIRLDDTASLSRIRAILTDVLNQERVDEISSFCQSIASSLRKMSQRNLAIAKLRIQKILFDYESSFQSNPERVSVSSAGGNSSVKPNPVSSELSDSAKSLFSEGNIDNPTVRSSQNERLVFSPKGRPSDTLSSRLQFDSASSDSLSFSSSKCENSVSSSRNDHPSPQHQNHHHHHRHSASTSKLPNCVDGKSVIDSSSLSLSKKSKHDAQQSSSNNKPSISLDSLHQKRHSELESSGKGSLLKVRPLLHNIQSMGLGGENSESDSPKPISAEQLKVLAKNLKITVTNSRALKSFSKSNSDESSSGESEEEETSEDESEEEEEKEKESATKETGIPNEGEDPNIQQTSTIGEDSSQIDAALKEPSVSEERGPDTKPDD